MNNSLFHVSFPGLGFSFLVNPVLVAFANFQIRWYGFFLAFGFLMAFLYAQKNAHKFGITEENILDISIWGVIFGTLGARTYYVLFYPGDFYILNPWKIFSIYEGGIAIYGAIIFGILGGVGVCLIRKIDVLSALDLSSFGLFIGQSIGRWGNFFNQEAFGSETSLPWAMVSEATDYKPVHPCFLYESLWCFTGFLILYFLSETKKLKKGQSFIFYIFWYATGRVFIEGKRVDSLIVMGLKVSQVVSFILIFLVLLIILFKKGSKRRLFK